MKTPRRDIRKNASIKAVASEVRWRADRAKETWESADSLLTNCRLSQQGDYQERAEAAWTRYSELDEIATHLERLALTH